MTVGTYPTETDGFYRTLLTKKLAEYYGLQLPEEEWFEVDYDTGRTKIQRSGDFSSCAKLGSKTSDLVGGIQQLETCFTEDLRGSGEIQNVPVIMTMGGNDLADVAQGILGVGRMMLCGTKVLIWYEIWKKESLGCEMKTAFPILQKSFLATSMNLQMPQEIRQPVHWLALLDWILISMSPF